MSDQQPDANLPQDEDQVEGTAPSETGRESEAVANASGFKKFFFLKTNFGILLTTLLVVGGVMAYFSLVKESLPDLDIPQATITTRRLALLQSTLATLMVSASMYDDNSTCSAMSTATRLDECRIPGPTPIPHLQGSGMMGYDGAVRAAGNRFHTTHHNTAISTGGRPS